MLAILVTLALFASSHGQQTMNFNYQPAGYQWYRTSGFRPGNRMTGFGNNIQRGFANQYPQQLSITMGSRGNNGGEAWLGAQFMQRSGMMPMMNPMMISSRRDERALGDSTDRFQMNNLFNLRDDALGDRLFQMPIVNNGPYVPGQYPYRPLGNMGNMLGAGRFMSNRNPWEDYLGAVLPNANQQIAGLHGSEAALGDRLNPYMSRQYQVFPGSTIGGIRSPVQFSQAYNQIYEGALGASINPNMYNRYMVNFPGNAVGSIRQNIGFRQAYNYPMYESALGPRGFSGLQEGSLGDSTSSNRFNSFQTEGALGDTTHENALGSYINPWNFGNRFGRSSYGKRRKVY